MLPEKIENKLSQFKFCLKIDLSKTIETIFLLLSQIR
jgi:hypothetical protein